MPEIMEPNGWQATGHTRIAKGLSQGPWPQWHSPSAGKEECIGFGARGYGKMIIDDPHGLIGKVNSPNASISLRISEQNRAIVQFNLRTLDPDPTTQRIDIPPS